MPERWAGVFPYLPSPLTPAGEIDQAALERVVEHCLAGGVHGLTPLGSSGELPYLPGHQRREVIAGTIRAAERRVPVVAGVGGFDSRTVVRDAREAVAAGSDGVMLVVLAYFPLTGAEILNMVEAVTAAVDVPVVLYNHPKLTHVELGASIVAKAHKELGVEYVKDASGAIGHIQQWRDAAGDSLQVFAATAVPPAAAMLLGACGWMSGPASVFPRQSVQIYDSCRRGDWAEAMTAQTRLDPALEVFRRMGPGRAVKAMLRAAGLDAGEPVPPLSFLSHEEIARVQDALHGLLPGSLIGSD